MREKGQLTLTERFDYGALCYVINSFDEVTRTMRERPGDDKGETLAMLKRYRAASRADGTRSVTYRQSGGSSGRYFADRGLSLQGMQREVRNAIAFPFYEDLDFANCHPSLLKQCCEREQPPVPCGALARYVTDREAVLTELCCGRTDPRAKDNAKAAVLAVMNGGAASPAARGVQATPWLASFEAEMHAVRDALVGRADSKYLEAARQSLVKRGHGLQNLMGSAINMLLCDIENKALMALREFLETETRRKVGVLVFDGCMLERERPLENATPMGMGTSCSTELLSRASEHVRERVGYSLVVAVKDMMRDRLEVPALVYSSISASPMPLTLAPAPRFAEDDAEGAVMLVQDFEPFVRSSRGHVYVLDGPIWVDYPPRVAKLLLSRCMGSNIRRISQAGEDAGTLSGNVPAAKRLIEAALALMPDDPTLEERMWQSNIGVVCFRNGLWDFRRRAFYRYGDRPDVMPRMCVPRDFPERRPSEATMAEVHARLLLSTLGDKDVVQTYLELMARATAGEYTDKQWAAMLGERNCGKGLLQEVNGAAWGPYVNTVNANAFLLQQYASGDAAKLLSWAMDCEYVRQTYTNEVKCEAGSRTIKLDGNLLKSFQSGGDVMSARKNHQDERSFRVASKLIMNLNDIPEVTPRDAVSTLVLIKFPFKFVAAEEMRAAAAAASEAEAPGFFRPRDDSLKTEFIRRQDVLDAFTWLVIDAYRDGPVVPCAKVRGDTLEYRGDVGDDLLLVLRTFKVTKAWDTDFVTLQQVRAFSSEHHVSYGVTKDRLIKMGGRADSNCCFGGVRHGRGIIGVRVEAKSDDI